MILLVIVCVILSYMYISSKTDNKSFAKENMILSDIDVCNTGLYRDGYPVNDYGETYGPDKGNLSQPDLLLAVNDDGQQGYIRPSELIILPGEAPLTSVPMYDSNGKKIVGYFSIS